jgi:hypothetical protein
MSARTLLRHLRAQGVSLAVDGADIVFDGPVEVLTDDLVTRLRAVKAELLAALGPPPPVAAWKAEGWQAYFDECAAVREYDSGQSRAEAEAGAFEDTIDQWLACHPAEPTSDAKGCVHCGGPERPWDALLPISTPGGGGWMHDRCWP